MIRVFTGGGLGNRLFQHSFAHFLKRKINLPVELVDCRRPNSAPHLTHMLSSVVSNCNHINKSELTNRLRLQIADPWTVRKHHVNISDTRERPFLSADQILISKSPKKKYIGYYQNTDFVYEVENELLQDLSSIIKSGIEYQKKYGPYEVVHIRGGDYRNHENLEKFGVLSENYYRKALEKSSDNLRFVVTDDTEWANTLSSLKPFDRMFGPKELNHIACLSLMSGSHFLVAANSTFSWWGGFLATSQGGEVIFPEPIFKAKNLASGNSLKHHSFGFMQALFV